MFVLIVTFSISILGMVLIPGVDDQGNVYHLTFFDAFYFVSYMASTIGFGESPYTFTYPQRLWVSFSIYMTVIGWFYAIGSIIALVQDKVLSTQLRLAHFQKQINSLNAPFIIFVGYNLLHKNIIQRLSDEGIHSVVIEKDEARIEEMVLANYTLDIPALQGDIKDPDLFEIAGISKNNCMAVVSLSSDDALNLHAAMSAKLLNSSVKVIVEATYEEYADNLKTIGIEIVENPFKIVAKRLFMALKAPSLLLLEQWIYEGTLRLSSQDLLPKQGKYIICGYGRMGKAIRIALKRAGIDYLFIETDPKKVRKMRKNDTNIISGDGHDTKMLIDAGIKDASCIIAGMNDDFINLSIVMAAKKLNPKIFTVARQNNILDQCIFTAAHIDRIIVVQNLLINQTFIAIAKPLSERFLRLIKNMGSEWGESLLISLKQTIGDNPQKLETSITPENAWALCNHIEKSGPVSLNRLAISLRDHHQQNRLIPLYLKRGDEELLLPDGNISLQINDKILFAGDKEAFEDLEYIMQNIYELHYVLEGESCDISLACKLKVEA